MAQEQYQSTAVPLESKQPTAALKYMTVPEKIELTSGGSEQPKMEASDPPNLYRPMKVPDKITLGSDLRSPVPPRPVGGPREGGEGGGRREDPGKPVGMEPRRLAHGQGGYLAMQEYGGVRPPFVMDQRVSGGLPPEQLQPHPPAAPPSQTAAPELEARVRSLEQRMDRLTEAVVRRDGAEQRKGNGFWTVLTFAGWIMVPLVVVYLYHYRKGI